MNQSTRILRHIAVALSLTSLLAANASAAPRATPAKVSKASQSWCVDDLCLGQPEALLKRFSSASLPPVTGGACADGTHRYVISRTDGSLEVTVDGDGKIVELARTYVDQISPAQFDKMAKETAQKLSASVTSRAPKGDATVLRLRSDAAQANAELQFAPKKAAPLAVKLRHDSSSGACLAHNLAAASK